MTDHVKQLAWHFLPEDRRLRYGDRRLVSPGDTIHHDGDPVLCESGLHASVRLIDALQYAPGPIVCRVEIGGATVRGDDKIVGTSRRVIWMADATDCLRAFARRCALDVIHLWDAPDVVVRYLKTGDESIRAAARDAAWDAADAARDAARDAAWAARYAARRAAWAARYAAWAARDAARYAAWAKQNRRLTAMISRLPRITA